MDDWGNILGEWDVFGKSLPDILDTEDWLLSKTPFDFKWGHEQSQDFGFLDVLIQAAEDIEKEEVIEEGKVGEKKPVEPVEEIKKPVEYVFIGRTKKKAPLQKTTLDQFFSKKTKLEKV